MDPGGFIFFGELYNFPEGMIKASILILKLDISYRSYKLIICLRRLTKLE